MISNKTILKTFILSFIVISFSIIFITYTENYNRYTEGRVAYSVVCGYTILMLGYHKYDKDTTRVFKLNSEFKELEIPKNNIIKFLFGDNYKEISIIKDKSIYLCKREKELNRISIIK